MKKAGLLWVILFAFNFADAQLPDKSWWTFTYPDKSLDGGLLNLRYLNEQFAGENGFIRLSEDGNSFVNGKNKEIRFWASNGGNLANEFNADKLDTLARFLAKMGVNMVRFHGAINPHGKNTRITDVDTTEVNNIWRCVAAMKKHGIYTVISPFWPHNGHMGGWIPAEWGIDGYSGNDDLWAVLYFNEQLKQGYKSWVKYLYTTPNPYTGVALKDEPAVAIIQVENEDAVFFWTIDAIKPALAKLIREQFFQWLKEKYGSLQAAKNFWGSAAGHKDDDVAKGIIGLFPIYELTLPENDKNALRLKDQVAFYAYKQRGFYEEMVNYYRDELGCKQLINGNNWRTASQSRLLDVERWTNSIADVIAVNKYFDPQHKGPNSGWRIDPGDFYGAPSALKNPAELPTNIKHVEGRPMMVTESGWNLPNKYQTEGALLIAAYGGLTGLDAFFWFFPTAPTFDRQPYFNFLKIKEQHPLNRWSISNPGQIGMFPANALIQRMGYVKKGKSVVEQRTLNSMFERKVPHIFEEQSFDPNRDFVFGVEKTEGKSVLSPLAFLTGGVSTTYGTSKDSIREMANLAQLIDTKGRKVTTVTGEQHLDYGKGIFILNTPKAKAVSGFLNTTKTFHLDDVTIQSDNEYATIELVSLDKLDIGQSKKILLQVGTIFRPTNWKEEPASFDNNGKRTEGFKITDTGTMPWLGMPALGSISIKNKAIKKATQLDAAGYAIKELPLSVFKDHVQLKFPENAYYILLER
ncbi:MAG: hypothetical protein ACOH2A_00725 [Sphingobacteriaceae bacterium]